MRRRLSLALLAVLVVLAVVVSTRYRAPRNQAGQRVTASADTMCFASRLFLPCDPR
jgi:hypothetical protein